MGGTGVNGHGASRPPGCGPIRNQGLTRFKIKESFAMRAIPQCGTEPAPD